MFVQSAPTQTSSSTNKKKPSEGKSVAETDPAKQSFFEILDSIVPHTNDNTKELNELWKDLPDLERALISSQNQKTLSEYKDHIKQIAELILKKNHKVMRAPSLGRNDTKDIRYIKVLDEKLDLLANTMFSPTNSAFSILKQMDEIRGLLIDLKG